METTAESPVFERTRLDPDRLAALADRVETASDGDEIAVITPITDERIGAVPSCDVTDVEAAVTNARRAQAEWAATPVDERRAVIERFGDLVIEHREMLLDLVQLETGKARHHALEEVLDVPLTCTYYAENGPDALADENRAGAVPGLATTRVVREPLGVVGVIVPWNYPLTLASTDAIAALLAGNAVVCKPDERTPFIALALAELLAAAGLPADCFSVVTGEGATVGPALIDRVDYVAFTGGTETGREVAAQAGWNLIGASLELGGKNPLVVLDDADPETAARGAAKGAFTNAGQLGLAPERIYVHESVYEEFLDEFVGITRRLRLGLAFEYGPDVGSLIDGDHCEAVADTVDEAVAAGASVLTGGRERPDVGPHCYEPTVLADVEPDAPIANEETFGPVVSVWSVPDEQAAIERANDSSYGLNASVFTGDLDRGRAVALEIDCGTVCVNDPYTVGWAAVDAPMGGVGDSGFGYRHGPEGIERFRRSRTIATSRIGPLDAPPGVDQDMYTRLLRGLTAIQRRLTRWVP